jgi:hypothetical protein
LSFSIGLHNKDLNLLKKIQSYFGLGHLSKSGLELTKYRVQSVNDLRVIINHFDKYPLITEKQKDYLLFKRVVNLINNKEHLTIEGLLQILAIKARAASEVSSVVLAT